MKTVIYGCWGSGTSALTKALQILGLSLGSNKLLALKEDNQSFTGESLELRALVLKYYSQQTLEKLQDDRDLHRELREWGNRSGAELCKFPLLAMCSREAFRAWPLHKGILMVRSPEAVKATMKRRGWGWWNPSHRDRTEWEFLPKLLRVDYEELCRDRRGQLIRICEYVGINPEPIKLREAISSIRPLISERDPRIFVSCPSLADPLLAFTVRDCFTKAARPDRIVFSIFDQSDHKPDELQDLIAQYEGQILYRRVEKHLARGVCWARGEAARAAGTEGWHLQIDPHMRFQPKWDEICFDQWAQCEDENGLVTAALPHFSPEDPETGELLALELRYGGWDRFGIPIIRTCRGARSKARPVPTAWLVAHWLFGPARFLSLVPHDGQIYFMGEEVSFAARLWTNGWNLYNPNRTAAAHHYSPKGGRPRHWEIDPNWRRLQRISIGRIKTLLGMGGDFDLGIYGLGHHRSLEEYQAFARVNFATDRDPHPAKSDQEGIF